ncbi:probable pectinesterase/pectinesterase inhibitor 46 [Lycium ferocissimum]|uniref:probable pectinesterase/pectinesterase inhibitor 46 n=1 Tax=Lycium ferocissimum TaxID=112874 RepID=UPI002815E792|nr:probable pectinesterase/pectinesterase inhibitor 46 [Lycium ferocissimum]
MASLNPWGKLDEVQNERLMARRKTRKRIAIIAISSIVLVSIIVGAVVGGVSNNKNKTSQNDNVSSIASTIRAVCNLTLYPDSCISSLSPYAAKGNSLKPQDIYKMSILVALNELSGASDKFFKSENFKNINDPAAAKALETCHELLSLAFDHLNDTLSVAESSLLDAFDDLRTWLSSAGTYQQTCIDSFENVTLSKAAGQNLKNSTEYTSNSLALISSLENSITSLGGAIGKRRLMGFGDDQYPSWLSSNDRKLLQKSAAKIKVNIVVARDGSGKYKTIKAAIKAAPEKSKKRFVIYVKKGIYKENVRIEKAKWNIMIIGDGKDATIVTGNRNFIDGTPTFQSATFAVFGKGFVARDIGFVNTAGAAKHQAVALMSTADESVFYRCKMDAFQDTLYPHSNRQFYRECNIYGTVDFIFGNSAVVLQNCNILPRKPMSGQQNTITAQGKVDPNQNTGISIQNCTVKPWGNLTGINTFLGRPWKNYSTTVFMQSNLGGFIHPTGWMPWVGTTAPNTIFYAEYKNIGAGANTKNRVNWKGLKLRLTSKIVSKFTVKPFIQGDKWLPAAGIPFKAGL